MENININSLLKENPILYDIQNTKEVFWINPSLKNSNVALKDIKIDESNVHDALNRLDRFSYYIKSAFPDTLKDDGRIESPLVPINNMKEELCDYFQNTMKGVLLLKCDNALPISGSIKARGGIYEVLKYAESLLIKNKLLSIEDDYSKINSIGIKNFFKNYSISVGSTGNLGLSIGIISSKLGFKVNVHMSSDAKKWKKDLLRTLGVNVIEYESDYSKAVEEGRKSCNNDEKCYFIDDENSKDLFLGYATAAYRLKSQLEELNIEVSKEHPLFVYLPCGVGGGPGGVAFGLKLIYGDNVNCFFAEPTHSPCMLLGSVTKLYSKICVNDLSIDNKTLADGLAVGRASEFIGVTMKNLLSGIYTIEDNKLTYLLKKMAKNENIYLEPSALAGVPGMGYLYTSNNGIKYIEDHGLKKSMIDSTHIAWATGGSMVPKEEMDKYLY